MSVISFKKRFAEAVRTFQKRQTIRGSGKAMKIKPGDYLQLYTGMRTRGVQKLGEVVCVSATPIMIRSSKHCREMVVELDGRRLGVEEKLKLAIDDGFSGTQEMFEFFDELYDLRGKHWFRGVLIKW